MTTRTLITGGAGFIGSHLAERLVERGDRVTALDDLSTGRVENVAGLREHERFQLVVDSIESESLVDELVHASDRIVHLAAAVGVRRIMTEPVRTIETNVEGTAVVLRSAHRFGRKVLLASSSEVYGNHADGPLREDARRRMGPTTKRRWAYAATKALDEFWALAYATERDLPVVVVRLFNTVGPRQTGRYGMVVPRFCRQALRGEPITVHGDGTQRRCFCHVEDVGRALVGLLDEPEASGEVYNVGSTEEVSIGELAERVRELAGSSSPIERIPYEEVHGPGFEDMVRRLPSIEKIERRTGWRPTRDLDAILRDVIEDQRGRI